MKRLFIAVEIPEKIKEEITELQEKLKAEGLAGRWVEVANIHLTIVFLGEIKEEEIPSITRLMEGSKMPAFSVECENLGGFPTLARPHTLWIGIAQLAKLKVLHQRLINNLQKSGFETEERKFQPHLTILRLGRKINIQPIIRQPFYQNLKFGRIPIKALILYESELTPRGAKHFPLKKMRLP